MNRPTSRKGNRMTTLEYAKPSDTPVDANQEQQPLCKDCWPLVSSDNKIPKQHRDAAELVKLWDGMAKVAGRYPKQNLSHAIWIISEVLCEGIEDDAQLITSLTPLAQKLERLEMLANYSNAAPKTIAEIDNKLEFAAKRQQQHDALLDGLLAEARKLGMKHAGEQAGQDNNPLIKEPTAVRHSRYIQRMTEFIDEGMKVEPASERLHEEELKAGRNPPKATTIKTIYTQRHKRPPGGKK